MEDLFSSDIFRQLDNFPLTETSLDRTTRVDLVVAGASDENNLPAYLFMNRISDSLYVDRFFRPSDIAEFDRKILAASN
jgi:hypothetical protein